MKKKEVVGIPLDQFIRAVGWVAQTPKHSAITSSQFVRLQMSLGRLILNLSSIMVAEMAVDFPLDEEWTIYVDRRILEAFATVCKDSKAAKVLLSKEGDRIVLRCGSRKVAADTVQEVTGYASWQRKGAEVSLPDTLLLSVPTAAKFAAQTAAVEHLACVYLTKGCVAATDSYAIFLVYDKKVTLNAPLPVFLASVIASGVEGICVEAPAKKKDTSVGVALLTNGGYLFQPVSTRCLNEFPLDTVQSVGRKARKAAPLFTISCTDLQAALSDLGGFVYEVPDEVIVSCTGAEGDKALYATLDVLNSNVRRRIMLHEAPSTAVSLKWNLRRLRIWVDYAVACGCKDARVGFLPDDHCNFFVGEDETGRTSVLAHAEITS